MPDGDKIHNHMLFQVGTLQRLLNSSDNPDDKWKAVTQEFYQLEDIVDSCYITEGLSPVQMRNHLLLLYHNYISEWKAVGSQIKPGLINDCSSQLASHCLSTSG
uniref:Uncharacterized protein n=1 Tax=Cyanothece sp. (strain PCC 7425 / ATCC 29141) TaxID=395961 RepID=B8HM67_CYAP4